MAFPDIQALLSIFMVDHRSSKIKVTCRDLEYGPRNGHALLGYICSPMSRPSRVCPRLLTANLSASDLLACRWVSKSSKYLALLALCMYHKVRTASRNIMMPKARLMMASRVICIAGCASGFISRWLGGGVMLRDTFAARRFYCANTGWWASIVTKTWFGVTESPCKIAL